LKRYCVGLCFAGYPPVFVARRKARPDWQRGLINAPGGEIKERERPSEAMSREFKEETGLPISELAWDPFLVEHAFHQPADALPNWHPYEVYYFRTTLKKDMPQIVPERNDGEPTNWMGVRQVLFETFPVELVGNLKWIIPMALDWRDMVAHVMLMDDIRRKAKW
jgi:8-oxo-dGTP pyrophosphatase MutT (NUDIX family)